MGIYAVLVISLLGLLGGCATAIPVPDGTRTVMEVAHIPSREEILTGNMNVTRDNRRREPVNWAWLHAELLKRGMQDAEILTGSVVIGRSQYYWHNVLSGVVRQYLRPATVQNGLVVDVGNVIEAEVVDGGYLKAVRVLYKSLAEGKCVYRRKDRSAVGNVFDSINPVGGPGAASLYCPDIEARGWFPQNHNMGVEWVDRKLTTP